MALLALTLIRDSKGEKEIFLRTLYVGINSRKSPVDSHSSAPIVLFRLHTQSNSTVKREVNANSKSSGRKFTGLKYYPIPVLWPCNESNFIVRYSRDQEDPSQRAGMELKNFVDAIPNDLFPRKSLLMHSMGNHVVFNGACGVKDEAGQVIDKAPDVQFENIFFVAAVSFLTNLVSLSVMHASRSQVVSLCAGLVV